MVMGWKTPISKKKANLLDAIPVRGGQVETEWEDGCAVLVFPRFKRMSVWSRLLPKSFPLLARVRLEEHGTAVWNLIDGQRTVREIVNLLDAHFQGETNYPSRVTAYLVQLQRDGFIRLLVRQSGG